MEKYERRKSSFKLHRLGYLVTNLRGEKKKSSKHQSLPTHVSEQFERDRTPVILAIPCSSAGETQLPAAEALEVPAANKNDPALMSYLNFLKLYLL